jgi:hypothetical protein
MHLSRKQIQQVAELAEREPEVQTFDVELNANTGYLEVSAVETKIVKRKIPLTKRNGKNTESQ